MKKSGEDYYSEDGDWLQRHEREHKPLNSELLTNKTELQQSFWMAKANADHYLGIINNLKKNLEFARIRYDENISIMMRCSKHAKEYGFGLEIFKTTTQATTEKSNPSQETENE